MRELLLANIPVQFCSTGWSLHPLIESNEACHLKPVGSNTDDVVPGDIVFCLVQPNNRYYVHLVWRKYVYHAPDGVDRLTFVIGNNKQPGGGGKKKNGWCYREHLIGKVYRTGKGEFTPSKKEIFDMPV